MVCLCVFLLFPLRPYQPFVCSSKNIGIHIKCLSYAIQSHVLSVSHVYVLLCLTFGRQSLAVLYCSAPRFLEDYLHGNITHKTARLVHAVVQGGSLFQSLLLTSHLPTNNCSATEFYHSSAIVSMPVAVFASDCHGHANVRKRRN